MSTKPLKQIGIWSGLWGLLRAIWVGVGVWGNFQTSWDIWQGWPMTFQNAAWLVSTWWFPIVISCLCLATWFVIEKLPNIVNRAPKPEPASVNTNVNATNASGSIVSASAGGNVHQNIYHGPSNNPLATEGPNPRIVALEDLKKLLRDGDKMLQDFYLGNWKAHSEESVADFDTRARACAQRGALDVTGQDWSRFDEPWEIDDTIMKAAALCDAGLLPNLLTDPFASNLFGKLYGRVERLRELLTALTGFKIESPYVTGGPASYTPNRRPDDTAPRVVPPKETEEQRDKRLGQVTLPRSGESMLRSVESLLQEINRHLDKYRPLLEHFAKDHSLPEHSHAPSVPKLLEVNDDLIRNCVAVESQTGGTAFRALGQEILGLQGAVEEFNDARNARNMHSVFEWSKQTIPKAITEARVEWTTRPS